MSTAARMQPPAGQFEELLLQFEALHREASRAAECADIELSHVAAGRRASLQNLHAYLALRSHDLEPLQRWLSHLGLAALEDAEPEVLAVLDTILFNLYVLNGQRPDPAMLARRASVFTAGVQQLRENTDRLFGPPPLPPRPRIMVTLPREVVDDPLLLQSMLRAGMDCARINCAYDDQQTWSGMIAQLREAETSTGLKCSVFMDLRGPKVRTGRMREEPQILKIRPLRARAGRVLRPARIWLTSTTAGQAEKSAADATLVLQEEWVRRLTVDDTVSFRDARGSARKWRIVDRTDEGGWAESCKTCYVANGVVLQLQNADGAETASTTVEALPPEESRVCLRPGDVLTLTCSDTPGEPAVHDLDGRLLRPGRMALPVPEVFRRARPGESIAFDDGRITGRIEENDGYVLRVRIERTRRPTEWLSSDKGVNLPETALDLPALGEEDLRDLPFLARNADIIGLSFTESPADVRLLRRQLGELGRDDVGVILKIETRRAFGNLPGILIEAMNFNRCGVMIARGDLAAECGFEHLANLQEDILRVCEAAHMPVTWATGVLEQLARRGHPSRAEVTDAASAQRSECVLLGKGPHIVRALRMLNGLLCGARSRADKQRPLLRPLRFTP